MPRGVASLLCILFHIHNTIVTALAQHYSLVYKSAAAQLPYTHLVSKCAFSSSKNIASAAASTTAIQSTHAVLTARGTMAQQRRPSSWASPVHATRPAGAPVMTLTSRLAIDDMAAPMTRATRAVTLHLAIAIDEQRTARLTSS